MKTSVVLFLVGAAAAVFAHDAFSAEAFVSQAGYSQNGAVVGHLGINQLLSVPITNAFALAAHENVAQGNETMAENSAQLLQIGLNNSATILQSGSGNLAAVYQHGQNNTATITQSNRAH